jgi:transposase
MRTAIPLITDHPDALKHRLQRERDGHKKPRLQMLYLLATGQAHTRQDVARLLGVHRNTIGRWLASYAAGGLDALLAPDVPAGKPVSLAPAVLASLEQALRRPEGFASYEALRRWVRQTPGVEVEDKTLYALVRTRFRAKLKVPRPSHTKKSSGHPGIPGHVSRAAGARHSSRQPPPGPGV